jgi:hypothetical protein
VTFPSSKVSYSALYNTNNSGYSLITARVSKMVSEIACTIRFHFYEGLLELSNPQVSYLPLVKTLDE